MEVKSEPVSIEIKEILENYREPSDKEIGVVQWGVKENLSYTDNNGIAVTNDAFIFHLIVPDCYIPDGELILYRLDGKFGEILCFKINVKSYPKYIELRRSDIVPHYLGKLSNNQHIIEMIAKYPESDLGDIKSLRRAIAKGECTLQFSVV